MRRNHPTNSQRDERDRMVATSPYLSRPLRTIEEAERALKQEMMDLYRPDPELFVHVPTPAGSLYMHKALLPKETK
jgi:hypothetical protein